MKTVRGVWLLLGIIGCGSGHADVDAPPSKHAEHDAEDKAPESPKADDEHEQEDGEDQDQPGEEAHVDDSDLEFEDERAANSGVAEVERARQVITERYAKSQERLETERLALAKERSELELARRDFQTQLDTIATLEQRLETRLGQGEIARERRAARLRELSSLLLNMAPQNAADMVAQMPNEDAQELILMMAETNERKASKLLSAMPGDRAATLGQLYLDRDPKAFPAPKSASAMSEEAPLDAPASTERVEP